MKTHTEDTRKGSEDVALFKAKKFSLWLFIIASFMIFAALSSGYIVYTASGIDKGIKILLPQAFITSTILIVVSSITVHLAYKATLTREDVKRKILLMVTILLGIGFFFSQYHSWQVLIEQGAYFINNNASQSFIYVFTGFHLVHILGGIIVLVVALFRNLNKHSDVKNKNSMELTAMFWHFLDILWIYIYVFLLLNQ
jgi:cytochrome c oxidase subunit 3